MRLLAGALAFIAVVVGAAGGATMLLERRLAGLLPGGVDVGVLRFNPYSGHLALTGVRGRDAAGRVIFTADAVEATADPFALLGGRLAVRKVHVASPRVVLAAAPALELVDLTAALGGRRAGRPASPLVIEGLVITGGSVLVEQAGEGGESLAIRNIDVRLNRLAAAAPQADLAFAVDMAVYGTSVQLTGQPLGAGGNDGGGYAVHVRARGMDLAAALRDVPLAGEASVEGGRGDVEGDLLLTGGRLLLSGHVRAADLVARLPGVSGPVRAAGATVVVDRLDVGRRAGRISRIDVAGLALALDRPAEGWSALREPLEQLTVGGDVVIRRVRLTDAAITLTSDEGRWRLSRVDVALSANERDDDSPFAVTARATVGRQGTIALSGVLGRDLRALDSAVTIERLDLAAWRVALAATGDDYAGVVGFDGRLRLEDGVAGPRATVSGHAVLTGMAVVPRGGRAAAFRADTIVAAIRRLEWPDGGALLDSLTFTRPTFTYAAAGIAGPWPASLATGAVTVRDGRVSGEAGEQVGALSIEAQAVPEMGGAAHVRLTAVVNGVGRLGYERWLPNPTARLDTAGMPLTSVLAAIAEACRSSAAPPPPPAAAPASALPRDVLTAPVPASAPPRDLLAP